MTAAVIKISIDPMTKQAKIEVPLDQPLDFYIKVSKILEDPKMIPDIQTKIKEIASKELLKRFETKRLEDVGL